MRLNGVILNKTAQMTMRRSAKLMMLHEIEFPHPALYTTSRSARKAYDVDARIAGNFTAEVPEGGLDSGRIIVLLPVHDSRLATFASPQTDSIGALRAWPVRAQAGGRTWPAQGSRAYDDGFD